MTLTINKDNLQQAVDADLGVSNWIQINQDMVNTFADVTVDHQFIHVDPERAAQTPFGGPIAHGFLTLSMLTYFVENGCGLNIENVTMGVNYGFDKVRFVQPVRVGKRVRGHANLMSAEEKHPGQFLLKMRINVEIEGEEKPALVAEWLTMVVIG